MPTGVTTWIAPSISEAKTLADSIMAAGLCVPYEPNTIGRPAHQLIDVIYTGILAAMTGLSHRDVEAIVTPAELLGGRIVRHGALSKRLRTPEALASLARLVHESADCARDEGCPTFDGSADLSPLALADAMRDAVGPFPPGASTTRGGKAAAILCRAIAHNMVVFGEAIDAEPEHAFMRGATVGPDIGPVIDSDGDRTAPSFMLL